MAYDDLGYELCRGLIVKDRIAAIRRSMLGVMAPFCDYPIDRPESLDRCFLEIAHKGQTLKSNVYKLFGRLPDVPLLLGEEHIAAKIAALGFSLYTIQSYSIFCLEPYKRRHMFVPHQDLKGRTSLKSLLIWLPLSSGRDLGGIAFYPGTHKQGPLRHKVAPSGQMQLPKSTYRGYEKVSFTDFEIGDCLFLNTYLIHESVMNTAEGLRWTAAVKIDDAIDITHVTDSLNPFVVTDYTDLRDNEDRLRLEE